MLFQIIQLRTLPHVENHATNTAAKVMKSFTNYSVL